jgi:folate-dependent phosphoribosylglycinamide formyltransferase PurN
MVSNTETRSEPQLRHEGASVQTLVQDAPSRPAETTGRAQRSKILFLGNSYNSLSVSALESLVESGHDVTVGYYDALARSRWQLLRKGIKSRGWRPTLQKGLRLLRCKSALGLRQLGVPLPSVASVPELVMLRGLKAEQCSDPNGAEFVEEVRRLGFDLIVVSSFSRILKKALIGVPRLGVVNVHPSLLPRYRGPEPLYWVLANGEKSTGVTLHYVDEGIDSGDIILQRKLEIQPRDTVSTLQARCAKLAASMLSETIPMLLAGRAPRIPQNHSSASYYSFPPRAGTAAVWTQARYRTEASQSVRAIDPLQDPRWMAFTREHPRASVFHTAAWLRALQRTYGYEPVVYTTSPPSSDLRNGVVFCRVRSWVTGRRLVSLPFSDHCEPLTESAEDLESILSHLRMEDRSGHCKYVELRPLTDDRRDRFEQQGFQASGQYYAHAIDLRPEEDQLLHRFHRTSIQQPIQRAVRDGMAYQSGRSEALLAQFYPLVVQTRRRHRVPPQPISWFRTLMDCLGDALTIHVASVGGLAVASILTISFRDTLLYKYAASDPAHHKLGSMPFLMWKAIQEAKSKSIQTFDLGRSDCDQQGLVDFKDHWAAERKVVTYWRSSARPKTSDVRTGPVFRTAGYLFECLPDSMLKTAGELLYRHIG